MADPKKRRSRDVASRAWQIVQEAIGEEPKYEPEEEEKNPAAVELGRRGGKARAEKLSKEERSEAAKAAAAARWHKHSEALD